MTLKPIKKSFKPIRATGVGLHGEMESIKVEHGMRGSTRFSGADKSTRWKKASEKTLLEILCYGREMLPRVIIALVEEHDLEDIGQAMVSMMHTEQRPFEEIKERLDMYRAVLETM